MKLFALACALVPLLACSPNYKSGSTKCDADLSCPSGYVCGASGTAGSPDVCYSAAETDGCGEAGDYWCPDSQTCWPSKAACETVTYCPDQDVRACSEGNFRPSCANDDCLSLNVFSCTPQTNDNSCMTCARQACCVELSNCKDDPDCLGLNACETGCSTNDASCHKRCENYYPSALTTQNAYWGCLRDKCGGKCS